MALGVNRWRTIWRVSVRAARPAIVSATVLATARALGEAIMLAMVSGGRPWAPNPLDGLTFLFEPIQPLAASIVKEFGDNPNRPIGHTMYAIGAVLLFSAALFSLAGWAAKQPLKQYGIGTDGGRRSRMAAARRRDRAAAPRIDRVVAADRPVAYWLCWAIGIGLCLMAVGIVRVHVHQGDP